MGRRKREDGRADQPPEDRQWDTPAVRPHIERLEWRRDAFGRRVLMMLFSDGTSAPVVEAG